MSNHSTPSAGKAIALDREERAILLDLLRQTLGETRIEGAALSIEELQAQARRQEEVMRRLLAKIERAGG